MYESANASMWRGDRKANHKTALESETQKGNRLIAAFMNVDVYNTYEEMQAVPIEKLKPWILPAQMTYHSSWNELMPVIEKISRIEYERWEDELPFGGTQTVIDTAYPRTFGMLDREGKPMFRFNRCGLFTADTLIEAAWLAVVDFISTEPS